MVEEIKSTSSEVQASPTGEYVRTHDGQIVPRGPLGEYSIYTTPMGAIIHLDKNGLPIQRGPKPQVIEIPAEVLSYSGGFGAASNALKQRIANKEAANSYPAGTKYSEKVHEEQQSILAASNDGAVTVGESEEVKVEEEMSPEATLSPVTVPSDQTGQTGESNGATSELVAWVDLQIGDIPVLAEAPWMLGDTPLAQAQGLKQLQELVRNKDAKGLYDKFGREGYTMSFMDKIYIESTILADFAAEQKRAEEAKAPEPLPEPVPIETVPTPVPIAETVPVIEEAAVFNEPVYAAGALAQHHNSLNTGHSNGFGSIVPGMTTVIIVVTFILTLWQLYKHFKRLMNSKVGMGEGFSTPQDFVDRTPLVNRASNSDAFVQEHGAAGQSTFDFDASEVGFSQQYDDYEEYSGADTLSAIPSSTAPSQNVESSGSSAMKDGNQNGQEESNSAMASLDKLMGDAKVTQRMH